MVLRHLQKPNLVSKELRQTIRALGGTSGASPTLFTVGLECCPPQHIYSVYSPAVERIHNKNTVLSQTYYVPSVAEAETGEFEWCFSVIDIKVTEVVNSVSRSQEWMRLVFLWVFKALDAAGLLGLWLWTGRLELCSNYRSITLLSLPMSMSACWREESG